MARVVGPLMSMEASGALGGAMVFSKWKGRPYVRQLVIPSNPKSDNQTSTRAMMAFLSQSWKTIADLAKATWEDGSAAKKISPFNHFTSVNMAAWTQFNSPTKAFPAAKVGTLDVIAAGTANGGVRIAQLTYPLTTKNNGWGALIFANTPTAAGLKSEVRFIVNTEALTSGNNITAVLTGLDPGTWEFQIAGFTDDGVLDTASSPISAVIT